MRTKTGDFNIVVQQVWILRNAVVLAGKEFLLEIEARSPGQITTNFEVLALTVAIHVSGEHAFGGLRVMRATGRVNVMVSGPPSQLRRIEPSLQLERRGLVLLLDGQFLMAHEIFRAATKLHIVFAVR